MLSSPLARLTSRVKGTGTERFDHGLVVDVFASWPVVDKRISGYADHGQLEVCTNTTMSVISKRCKSFRFWPHRWIDGQVRTPLFLDRSTLLLQ